MTVLTREQAVQRIQEIRDIMANMPRKKPISERLKITDHMKEILKELQDYREANPGD
jgi:hypothetical protein